MYEYRSSTAAQTELQRTGILGVRSPESMSAYLRGLRRMLTVRETAKILGRHRETVYDWIAAGLPATKHGRTWRIDPIRLAAWIEAQ